MDKTRVCGTLAPGSIPGRGTRYIILLINESISKTSRIIGTIKDNKKITLFTILPEVVVDGLKNKTNTGNNVGGSQIQKETRKNKLVSDNIALKTDTAKYIIKNAIDNFAINFSFL